MQASLPQQFQKLEKVDFNRVFVENMIPKLEYPALVTASKMLKEHFPDDEMLELPDLLPSDYKSDEDFLEKVWRFYPARDSVLCIVLRPYRISGVRGVGRLRDRRGGARVPGHEEEVPHPRRHSQHAGQS